MNVKRKEKFLHVRSLKKLNSMRKFSTGSENKAHTKEQTQTSSASVASYIVDGKKLYFKLYVK